MPSADAAWYRMDRPTNHMVINGVLTFDEPLDLDALAAVVQARIVEPYPRFRQRVVESGPLGAVHWEDADFDLDLHLHRLALPSPGDDVALKALVADLMSAGLDADKPLWDMYLVEGYGDGCALVMRMHHCIADGIALARVMLSIADAEEGGPARPDIAPPDERGGRSLLSPPGPLKLPVRAAEALLHESLQVLRDPAHLLDLGREVRDDAAALAEIVFARNERSTALKGEHGVAQRVGWTTGIPLPEVKALAHATGTTVNDVLTAALSGAMARYLEAGGEEVDELHVMVPFNIRPLDRPLPAELGNKFGLILLGLPIRADSARTRLQDVHERMERIKASRQPAVSYAILGAMGAAPVQVEELLIDMFSAKSTSVVTNVPGPREPVRLAGRRIRDVLFWAPCAGSVGMSVSIFSYRDEVTVGFMTHASLVPDPGVLAAGFRSELEALAAEVGQPSVSS